MAKRNGNFDQAVERIRDALVHLHKEQVLTYLNIGGVLLNELRDKHKRFNPNDLIALRELFGRSDRWFRDCAKTTKTYSGNEDRLIAIPGSTPKHFKRLANMGDSTRWYGEQLLRDRGMRGMTVAELDSLLYQTTFAGTGDRAMVL